VFDATVLRVRDATWEGNRVFNCNLEVGGGAFVAFRVDCPSLTRSAMWAGVFASARTRSTGAHSTVTASTPRRRTSLLDWRTGVRSPLESRPVLIIRPAVLRRLRTSGAAPLCAVEHIFVDRWDFRIARKMWRRERRGEGKGGREGEEQHNLEEWSTCT